MPACAPRPGADSPPVQRAAPGRTSRRSPGRSTVPPVSPAAIGQGRCVGIPGTFSFLRPLFLRWESHPVSRPPCGHRRNAEYLRDVRIVHPGLPQLLQPCPVDLLPVSWWETRAVPPLLHRIRVASDYARDLPVVLALIPERPELLPVVKPPRSLPWFLPRSASPQHDRLRPYPRRRPRLIETAFPRNVGLAPARFGLAGDKEVVAAPASPAHIAAVIPALGAAAYVRILQNGSTAPSSIR